MPRAALRRAHLCVLTSVSVIWLGACATGPGGVGRGPSSGPSAKPPGVASSAHATPAPSAIGPATSLRCGKQEITVRANAEQAELSVGSKRYLLQAQRSASGARYASPAYPGTSYWSKGDSGMLMIDGQAYPECAMLASAMPVVAPAEGGPPRDLTVREWVVESIDGRGVVDNSRTTLVFDPRGQISGRAGCNRYSGSLQIQGARLEARGLTTTRMICVPALMEQEARFLKALDAASTWRLQPDGSLLLTSPDGRKLLAR